MFGSHSSSGDILFSLLIALAVLVLLFLICRIVFWYVKINQKISRQSVLIDLLKEIQKSLNQSDTSVSRQAQTPETTDYERIDGKSGEAFCSSCRTTSPVNGMYHHRKTDAYYHKDCLPK